MMTRDIHRYEFRTALSADEIENTLLLAVLAAECLYGASRVRLEARYWFDSEKRSCTVDASTDVGRAINRVFTGFAIREFGERSFKVRRVDTVPDKAQPAVA